LISDFDISASEQYSFKSAKPQPANHSG